MSETTDSHGTAIRDEFAHQADAFVRSPTMSLAETLGVVVDLVPAAPEARWVDLACGPGLVARAMAPGVSSVRGFDLTPAMVEKARSEAAADGVENFITDDDAEAAAWREEIERLRDPSHWALLTTARIEALAGGPGWSPTSSARCPSRSTSRSGCTAAPAVRRTPS